MSRHLPVHLYCPYWPCTWIGNRLDGLKSHLDRWECGPYPEKKQREIYDKDTIMKGILSGRYTVEEAAGRALALVSEKARRTGLGGGMEGPLEPPHQEIVRRP